MVAMLLKTTLKTTRCVLLPALVLLGAACTQYVETPTLATVEPKRVPSGELASFLGQITPPVLGTGVEPESHPTPRSSVDLLRKGDDLGYGVTMTKEAEILWEATLNKKWWRWDEQFEAAKASLPDTPEAQFLLSAQRLRAMMHSGRMGEVRKELKRLEQIERELFGDVIETNSQYAQLNSWLNNSEEAIAYNAVVVEDIGDWWIPEFYYAPPENVGNAKRVAGALMRSHIGLTCENIVIHEYETSMAWGRAGLDLTESVLGITHHPLYGLLVKTTAYMYEGQAWLMACYAAARIGVSGDIAANQYLIDGAKSFLRQAEYRWGDLLVDSIIDYVLYDRGLKPQETEVVGVLGDPEVLTPDSLAKLIKFRPEDFQAREGIELPAPEPDTIQLPGEGEINAYHFAIGPRLAEANGAILAGQYDQAVAILDELVRDETDPLRRWHAAEEAVRTLILAGRSAEALDRLPELETLEIAFYGTNVGARALRGEIKFWLGDTDGALRDFSQVVDAVGDFRPPALFVFKPQIPQLALMTRAQYRAYLGVARTLMYTGQQAAALPWANAAEELFEESHYSWQHELYREYLKLDADMFYARGVNLGVLAGARLVVEGDRAEADRLMGTSRAYLDALGFDAGQMVIEATWARSLLDAGEAQDAERVATRAAEFAAETGQVDLSWQVQALRAEALAALGRDREAERALRAAQADIEAVSGTLATDASKRQFGTGKEEITRKLVARDLAAENFAQAFTDLERGRARAFVDMLGQVSLDAGGEDRRVNAIREIDAQIRQARVLAALPGRSAAGSSAKIAALQTERRRRVQDLRRRDGELADAFAIANQRLQDVQRRLGAKDLLLYTLPTGSNAEEVAFLAITRNRARVIETGTGHDKLEDLLAIFATDDPLGQADAQAKAAREIAAALDLAEWVPDGTLYVVPSRALYFVPWGALAIESPVVVLPNGGWLTRAPAGRAGRGAVVVGDPTLGLGWDTLPGAEAEAQEIAGLYSTQPLIGPAASKAALRDRVGDGTRILHLATHGLFDARQPLDSAILLSGEGETDRLSASELFEAPLRADLVVLSACETGLGQVTAGDDFLGLARSFYLGGARAVVNSLWPVHDKPTRLFMESFHEAASSGAIGGAWLSARNRLREEGFPPSVYGAFVLGGSDRI